MKAIAGSGGTIEISNSLITGAQNIAIDVINTQGTISFTTIVTSGPGPASGARAIACSSGLSIRDSIIWTPGSTLTPIQGGCTLATSIAGPTPVPGALNIDPLFVGLTDFHLSPNSPAKDLVDNGPTVDFEGEPRPRGIKFDIGADEAAP